MSLLPEDRLIRELISFYKPHARVKLPPGDDAMTVSEFPLMEMVISIDAFYEGVHFKKEFMDLKDVGHKSLAAALSDLAAVGATPITYLVNLEVPPEMDIEEIKRIYQGYDELNNAFCITPSGGNIVKGDRISLVTTVIGEVERGMALKRTGMREGDVVVVTGDLGRPAAALRLYNDPKLMERMRPFDTQPLFEKFKRPWPRIKEIQNLKKELRITSIIDISDGLGMDLYRLAVANEFIIEIEESKLPVHPSVVPLLEMAGLSAWEVVAESGEEYELVFTIPEEDAKKLDKLEVKVTPIGKIVAGFRPRVVLKKRGGGEVDISQRGFDQRRSGRAEPVPQQAPAHKIEGEYSQFPQAHRDQGGRADRE